MWIPKVRDKILWTHISGKGIRPTDNQITAIQDMPPSGNISELRRVVGMIKYLVRFIPDLVTVISPMKDMFKASNMLMWSHKQDESSTRLKALLTSAQLPTFYDQTNRCQCWRCKLWTWSSYLSRRGWIIEADCILFSQIGLCSTKTWHIVKECLPALWACENFSRCLVFYTYSDFLRSQTPSSTDEHATLRCQQILICLCRYNLVAKHIPGYFTYCTWYLVRLDNVSDKE